MAESPIGSKIKKSIGSALASVATLFTKEHKHHLIPNEVYERLADEFDAVKWFQNHKDNLMKLPVPFHGNHPAYNHYVQTQVQNLLERGNVKLEDFIKLQSRFRAEIERIMKNNPGINLNDYFKKLGYSTPKW